jgi:NAD(P)-dependent dehydrogenase (short-subunit alcohol dehydrogenase family)
VSPAKTRRERDQQRHGARRNIEHRVSSGVSLYSREGAVVDLGLGDNVVVVVGGASGIGQAIASAFATEGARVAILDIASPNVVDERSRSFLADVTDYPAVTRAAAAIQARFSRIDHVVFAAAVGSGKFGFPFWNLDPSDWERVLSVNLIGAVNVSHAFAPGLAKQKRGTMLFLASVAGQTGSQTDPPYSASKAGLINFAQCAAKDLAPFGVRVNALCPGMVQTPLNRSVWQAWADRQPPEMRQEYEAGAAEKIAKLVPLNRWQSPEDIAAMAVFLASDRAANVTGQTINVDGGYVMHW